MSHVSKVDMEILDLDALKKACADCGLEFREGQKTYKWYGSWVGDYNSRDAATQNGIDPKDLGKCDHAIGVPGNKQAYEIGVVKNPNGKGYILLWDFWNGGYGLQAKAGPNCGNLTKGYAVAVAKKAMVNKGYSCTQKILATGEVQLQFVKA